MTNDEEFGLARAREFWDRAFRQAASDVEDTSPGCDLSGTVNRLRAASAVEVLDVGCGFGRWSIVLAKAGFRVRAVDLSSVAVKIVRERALRDGLDIDVEVCAAQELLRLGVRVDAVVCNSVLDHMRPPDAEQSARNIAQVLKPGGVVFVSFDGTAEAESGPEATPDYLVGPDGTWEYVAGSRRGMTWRFYDDNEIRHLFREFEELDFTVATGGSRRVWFRKPLDEPPATRG